MKMMHQDFETLGLKADLIDTYVLKDAINSYRKKVRLAHPDKFPNASEEDKKLKTAEIQELNNAYERVLQYILENSKNIKDAVNDEEIFMKENFGKFNFPKENNGSFTIIIQHCDADIWQQCLGNEYGEPTIRKNNEGTICDVLWKFAYEDSGQKSTLTLHIYNKPVTKKESKILVQGRVQSLTCLYVFSVLPKIYKKVCEQRPKSIIGERRSKPDVKCEKCKFTAPMIEMKMHLKRAHGPKPSKALKRLPNFTPAAKTSKKQRNQTFIALNTEGILDLDTSITLVDKTNPENIVSLEEFTFPPVQMESLVSCDRCEYDCSTQDEMNTHMKTTHDDILSTKSETILEVDRADPPRHVDAETITEHVICGECDSVFTTIKDCEEHMKHHPSKCFKCDFISEDKSVLHNHEMNQHMMQKCEPTSHDEPCNIIPIKKFHCKDCNVIFYSIEELNIHTKQHKRDDNTSVDQQLTMKCDQCDFIGPDVKTFINHILNAHKQIVGTCERCGYEATSKEVLETHMIEKHADLVLMNIISGQIVENTDMFKGFMKELTVEINKLIGGHNNMMQEISLLKKMVNADVKEPTRSEIFCCEDCDYKSSERSQLKRHKNEVHIQEPTPSVSPSYADVAKNTRKTVIQPNKTPFIPRKKKVLWVGDSHSNNLDKEVFETYTESEIDMVTAYTVDADEDAKYKDKNLMAIVPKELEKKKVDVLVLQSGCNEISNLDCLANPSENSAYWEQVVYLASEKMFDLAKHCVTKHSGLKVVILTRPPRYDLPEVDPKQIKNKLTQFGNNILTNLWMKNGCPENILIADQNLGCYGELRNKRFGYFDESQYDGIHMRGPLARQHYTTAVLRIFKETQPSLFNKELPKITKPQQQYTGRQGYRTSGARQGISQSRPADRSRQYYHNTGRSYNSYNYNYKHDEHRDCPQNTYQRSKRAQIVNPGVGFTLPTQNRFNTFYTNQGNF